MGLVMDIKHQAMMISANILTKQNDAVINSAITHALGDGWLMDKVIDRVKIFLLRDGTEVLSVDGQQLVLFYPIEFESRNTVANVSINYRLLYSQPIV